ncbi:MAG: hypothetical protein HQK78_10100 [Desulfobacterales bacterium]|nr:hypothetical protein [Desulfobacterales bacterium]
MTENKRPIYYDDVEKCVDDIIKIVGKNIIFGMPLALGKPIPLINALYNRVKSDTSLHLAVITALSLEKPTWSNELERRFLQPFVERVWKDIPDFQYILDIRKNNLPSNFVLKEFYFKAGQYIHVPEAQQNYVSSNYTHAIRDSLANNINVCSNIIAKKEINGEVFYSMSCNADTSVDASNGIKKMQAEGKKCLAIGEVNNNLPFMYGDVAVTKPDAYDMVIENPIYDFPLFSVPRPVVSVADHMIGINVSSLIKDGGTLQIGIGALGDAIASGLKMRHETNTEYRAFLNDAGILNNYGDIINRVGGLEPFKEGLYGSTEMFVDAFLQLYKMGILKRKIYHHEGLQRLINEGFIKNEINPSVINVLLEKQVVNSRLTVTDFNFLKKFGIFKEEVEYIGDTLVYKDITLKNDLDDKSNRDEILKHCLGTNLKNGILLTGAFFIGPNDFYQSLRDMSEEEIKQFEMTSVLISNQLYGDEKLRSLQRKDGRFINTGMIATLFGNVASDMLEDGTVVSGVGGQYNFVSMAHALPDGRSIIMIKSTRTKNNNVLSNILYNYGHVTIPRQLRDIVITEYGIADLRAKSNKEVIIAMINIADSRFQEELVKKAIENKKLPKDYKIPDRFRNNYPEKLEKLVSPYRKEGFFKVFPSGTDLTPDEIAIGKSLRMLKEKIAAKDLMIIPDLIMNVFKSIPKHAERHLERMQLDRPSTPSEMILQKIVVYALSSAGQI